MKREDGTPKLTGTRLSSDIEMIFIANGMPKSASSFSFLLAQAIVLTHPERIVSRQSLPGWLQSSFFQSVDELLPALLERVATN